MLATRIIRTAYYNCFVPPGLSKLGLSCTSKVTCLSIDSLWLEGRYYYTTVGIL